MPASSSLSPVWTRPPIATTARRLPWPTKTTNDNHRWSPRTTQIAAISDLADPFKNTDLTKWGGQNVIEQKTATCHHIGYRSYRRPVRGPAGRSRQCEDRPRGEGTWHRLLRC